MVFWRIRDGKLAERWVTLDRMGLYQQLTAKQFQRVRAPHVDHEPAHDNALPFCFGCATDRLMTCSPAD
jgi:hypothetical protein